MVIPGWVVMPQAVPGRPRVVHVNATATGGGVAELLHGLVPAQNAAGLAAGWAVIGGTRRFYSITKRLHHLLHDNANPKALDGDAFADYRAVLAEQEDWFHENLIPGDVVCLHDPQTLGLAPALADAGVRVIWHCHIGTSRPAAPGPSVVWRAFSAELARVDAVITTLAEFAPPVPPGKRHTIEPAIDLCAPKNRELTEAAVAEILFDIGLTDSVRSSEHSFSAFETAAAPDRRGAVVEQFRLLPAQARVVAQVSRWDPLKDMPGVLRQLPGLPDDVHVVLVGPDPAHVLDDPEGFRVLREVRAVRDAMSPDDRVRVHLVLTSLRDADRAALVVNAVQRRADVVLLKSIEEGFGLAATEAMAKGRAVVAGAVGGLRRQILDGRNGLLVDPADQEAVRGAVLRLLDDPALRERLGAAAAARVAQMYTMPRLVADYARLLRSDPFCRPPVAPGPPISRSEHDG